MGNTLPPACRGRGRPRRGRGSAVAPTAGFVGRQDELAILSERFSEAARGRPQVVYLEGEAGSGKSTLLSRFLGSLSDAVVLQAGGDEDESLLSYGSWTSSIPMRPRSAWPTGWRPLWDRTSSWPVSSSRPAWPTPTLAS
jgi:hypothetical protein